MTGREIFKYIDKAEIIILKGLPIPLTPMVIVDKKCIDNAVDKIRKAAKDSVREFDSNEIKNKLSIIENIINDGMKISSTPWVIVNHSKIVINLDKIRESISTKMQEIIYDRAR